MSSQGNASRELLEEHARNLKQYIEKGEYINALEVAEQLIEMEEKESYWITVGYVFTQMKEYERSLVLLDSFCPARTLSEPELLEPVVAANRAGAGKAIVCRGNRDIGGGGLDV